MSSRSSKSMLPNYVLITPARNEAQYIELTIKSVIAQTVKPLKWVVVSDGSTDGTDEIVGRYAEEHSWIELIRMPDRTERHFAGKVYAFNAGHEQIRALDYDVVASLDADISFDADYFSFLLQKFASDSSLGVAGTPFKESFGEAYDYRFVNIEHVSGACQLFRRQCFNDIGGYIPVKGGSIDHIAVLTARMKGWGTRTFPDKVCLHHRAMGTAQGGALRARMKIGAKDYAVGNHPLWELFRVWYQMTRKPRVIGGLMVGVGYAWAMCQRRERPVSHQLLSFQRQEQMKRLKRFLVSRSSRPDQQLAQNSHTNASSRN